MNRELSVTMVDGRVVANFVLDFCEKRGRTVTNLELQKFVYFCHVWSLVQLGKPLVRHQFEAWQHGPVLQYLYRDFKEFKEKPITTRAHKLNPTTGLSELVEYDFDKETTTLLERVIDSYRSLTASQLRELSHVKGGPWEAAWKHEGKINLGMKIENSKIERFYKSRGGFFPNQ